MFHSVHFLVVQILAAYTIFQNINYAAGLKINYKIYETDTTWPLLPIQ